MSQMAGWIVSLIALYLGANCALLVWYTRSLSRLYREAHEGWGRALELAKQGGESSMLNPSPRGRSFTVRPCACRYRHLAALRR